IFKNSPNPILAENAFLEIHPFKRFAKPIEVAKSVVWLCSDSASYINGVSLPIDGGLTAH
ncbi:MAG: SDR family oxidoreductase, partial [Spirochaetia bacterium]|nr:SDR family oxidoreductase [Spirochaetia bacterium]